MLASDILGENFSYDLNGGLPMQTSGQRTSF